jgi:ketosteroid isomerase-like protein
MTTPCAVGDGRIGCMRKPKIPPGSSDDTEATFYDALQHADIERLMGCWADEDDIVCVQPGGPRLIGHAAVRAAFEAMFANGSVQAFPEKVRRLDTGALSVHSVVERVAVMVDDGLQNAWVLATNVYAKTAQGWRMVAHHASPGVPNEPADVPSSRPVLH